uniref:Uncharacterized protein n=1 Tax=Tanacetum cinerariifolium TaxID=118510 RepID=A0A699JZS0_TANCI|nr:hypothetical protein [Tanacetum cinerariifolium]
MSDAEHFTVMMDIHIYTSISSDDGSSDVGSPAEPPPLDFVHEPVYPEFMPLEDDVLLVEEQPLPTAVLLTVDSQGYITESDPEEDLEEEDDKDPEEDPTDYPTDIDDNKDGESSGHDADDEEDEEEEHLAPTDSIEVGRLLAILTLPPLPFTSYSSPLPQIPSSPLPTSPTDARTPLGYRAAMIRLGAKSPSTSHLLPLPPPIVLPYTIASMVKIRVVAPSTYILAPRSETPPSRTPPLLPIPLPTSSPPLFLPSTDCRADVPEPMLPPQKRLCIALGLRFEVRKCSSDPTARPTGGFRVDYGFVSTLDAEIRCDPKKEIGYGITDV